MSAPQVLSAGDVSRLSGLQLLAKQVVEGFSSGLHRSPHKGFSVEFREHRAYVPGDDIRTIDWKLFGKTDRLYIREYEEETNLRCTILLDCSGSMGYRGSRAGGPRRRAMAGARRGDHGSTPRAFRIRGRSHIGDVFHSKHG